MLNEIFMNLAKFLFGIGILCLFLKMLLGRKNEGVSEKRNLLIYNLHKVSFGFTTIFAFMHGLTYLPVNQTYIITGWLFGIFMFLLCIAGVRMGFKSNWNPYSREERTQNKKVRLSKWILTIVACIFLGTHYLL